jgi:hypothetical protein
MDIKAKIYDRIEEFISSSSDEAIQNLYDKINDLMQERDNDKIYQEVINFFFSNNSYYYNPTTNMYIEYIEQFKFIPENEMIHIVLQFLTRYHDNAIDFSLKQRIKNKIIKKIKEKHIHQNIPESNTLQDILNFLHPNFFTHKNYAKYFMITLGDIIMKKTDLLYFLPIHIKPFLKNINRVISLYFHNMNIFNHYKFQYYDHDPTKSRVISFNKINLQHITISETFYINLICVSLHYSNRHNSGDSFLNEPGSQSISQLSYWIKDTPREQIIDDFISSYISMKEGHKIHEKDMLFLWKEYLKNLNKINVFQRNIDFYTFISKNIQLTESYYVNCTSMFLPYVHQFKDFWEKYMYDDATEYYFEISEILKLFIEIYKDADIEEQHIIELIQYYYPDKSVIDNKINKIGCILWNKKKDIDNFLLKNKCNIDNNELYSMYCKCNKKIVSKLYFTQYLDTLQNS